MPENPIIFTPFLHDTSTGNALTSDAGFGARAPWVWATVPAIALGALTFAFLHSPLPLPLGASVPVSQRLGTPVASAAGDWIVPASETLVVARHSNDYVLLRGSLQPPVGTTLVAPSGGQIAQVLARPGQAVRAGQALLMISRGVSSARSYDALPPPGVSRAERDQVSAERQGTAAQDSVRQAHTRLDAAQNRVQAAQERVARARDLVRRLQNGEEVGNEETSTPALAPAKPAISSKGNEARLTALREKALRESQKQGSRADAAEQQASEARRTGETAEANARSKERLAQSAQSALEDLRSAAKSAAPGRAKPDASTGDSDGDKDSNDKTSSSDAPSTPTRTVGLRAAQNRAQAARASADDAQSRAMIARHEADKAKNRAADLRAKANDAARDGAAALQNLQVFDSEKNATSTLATASTPKTTRTVSGEKVTAREAARIVRSAVAESEAAVADADRIRRQVENLDRPISTTARRVVSSKKRFDVAQQEMWQVAREVRPSVSRVAAPESGVVLWIAEPTREVGSGEPLGAIGRADRLEVVLRDTSGAWKSAKPGSTILALVQPSQNVMPRVQPASTRGAASAKPRTANAVLDRNGSLRGVPTLARVLAVTPPARAGWPALIKIAVHNPRHARTAPGKPGNMNYGMAGRAFEPGTPVVCSLSKPAAGRAQIVVPAAAIRRDADNEALVAVLAPAQNAISTGGIAPTATCLVEWRKVQLGRGDGFQNVVLSGLEIGDRIALQPDAIYDFTLAHGAQATLRVEQA